jgi:glycosyltransferase involved in cell wall biosynthesis
MSNKKKLVFTVNVDWFFCSHRLPLALEGQRRGFEVYVVGKDTGSFKNLEELGIKCILIDFERSGRNPLKEIAVIRKLRKLYEQLNPDIVHQITLKPSIYGTLALNRINHKARVFNAVSGLGYSFINDRRNFTTVILVSLLKKAFAGKRSNFIFQNPDDKQFYESLDFLTDTNYSIIKGSGVDESIFSYNSPTNRQKLTVILLARMLYDKGVMDFIAAAENLRAKHENKVEFLLAGGIDPENPAHIKEETLSTKCDGTYIKWLGHSSNVKGLYEQADIVCLPSYREGLPKSLVEAMAIGRPIITTDTPGCRECVVDGQNGYLVPVKDHNVLAERINTLLSDGDLRLKMGLASRQMMEKEMSLKTVIEKTFNFYEQVN